MIAGQPVGSEHPPYVIAEISGNHGGDLKVAVELIQAAKAAGADAVKFQHYKPETITVRSPHPDFRVKGGTLWDGTQLADLYARAMTPWEWTAELANAASEVGIAWFSSPFDTTAVDFLEQFDPPAYKVASFEIVDLPFIRYIAGCGRPVILSTGMATLSEIDAAVRAAQEAGAASVAVLRCNSGYPARTAEMDLAAIPVMAKAWGLPVGLSDHTLGHTAAVVAVALGACIVEKHITLRRNGEGPDDAFSAEPHEFRLLVNAVREGSEALGSIRFGPSAHERASLAFRRSIRAVLPLAKGDLVTTANVRSIRPAGGLTPDCLTSALGMVADRDIQIGEPITWRDLRPSTAPPHSISRP